MTWWKLETETTYFQDVDTKRRVDDTLTWLSPDGDPSKTFVETLGHMTSEAYNKDRKKVGRCPKGTQCEFSEWETATSANC